MGGRGKGNIGYDRGKERYMYIYNIIYIVLASEKYIFIHPFVNINLLGLTWLQIIHGERGRKKNVPQTMLSPTCMVVVQWPIRVSCTILCCMYINI